MAMVGVVAAVAAVAAVVAVVAMVLGMRQQRAAHAQAVDAPASRYGVGHRRRLQSGCLCFDQPRLCFLYSQCLALVVPSGM